MTPHCRMNDNRTGGLVRTSRAQYRVILASGWPVAMDDLAPGSVRGGGAVRMQDESPAPSMNAHIVMELTQKCTIRHGSLAAVALVPQVVDIAGGGSLTAAGPFAVPGAQRDGAANVAGDLVGVPDVEDDRLAVVRGGEQALAQDARRPSRPGDELDREPGDR